MKYKTDKLRISVNFPTVNNLQVHKLPDYLDHRINKAAIIRATGNKFFILNHLHHNTQGPACIYHYKHSQFCVYGLIIEEFTP